MTGIVSVVLAAAVVAAPRARESQEVFWAGSGYWDRRHAAKLAEIASGPREYDFVFLGDSITHNWEGWSDPADVKVVEKAYADGKLKFPNAPGLRQWNVMKRSYSLLNLGIGGDTTSTLLWRLRNGALDGYRARGIALMIGTNDPGSVDDVVAGVRADLDEIRLRQPQAKVVLMPIFPRDAKPDSPQRLRRDAINRKIAAFADGVNVLWLDFNSRFLTAEGELTREMMPDLLHPLDEGYLIWRTAMEPVMERIVGKRDLLPLNQPPLDGGRGEWQPKSYGEIAKEKIFDEAKVPKYVLPDPLVASSGRRVDAEGWRNVRRAEVLKLIAENEYGFPLPPPTKVETKVLSEKDDALGGLATRREVRLTFHGPNGNSLSATMLLYIPNGAKDPVPVFLCLNFDGNQTTTSEEDVSPLEWRVKPVGEMRRTEKWSRLERGVERAFSESRWPYREIVRRGYAVGTVCYHEFYPDLMDAGRYSALALFMDAKDVDGPQRMYTPIGAWAWGLSRMLDYCETEPRIDAKRAAVAGHSRLGKTALWAGAVDERFRLVCPNNSGCGGVALHKRRFGEVIEDHLVHRVNREDAFWFTEPFAAAWGREDSLPYDQHEVVALVAPRTIAVGVATKDVGADPKGEYLSVKAAAPVWDLLGAKTSLPDEMPVAGGAIVGPVSFHVREGGHDMLLEDWNAYMDVADSRLRGE